MSNQVVARFLNGRLLKGTSLDVDPGKPVCHVRPSTGPAEEVMLADLKALFFVRSLEGDAHHEEGSQPDPADPRLRGSVSVKVRFQDGETVIGLMNRYPPNRPYFFVVPVDQKSNNVRILVNRAAVASLEPGVGA